MCYILITEPISTRYTHTHKRKEFKCNTKRQSSKEGTKNYKHNQKIINKTVITTLNITVSTWPKCSQSKDRVAEWIQKQETPFKSKNTLKTESEGMEKGIPCKWK